MIFTSRDGVNRYAVSCWNWMLILLGEIVYYVLFADADARDEQAQKVTYEYTLKFKSWWRRVQSRIRMSCKLGAFLYAWKRCFCWCDDFRIMVFDVLWIFSERKRNVLSFIYSMHIFQRYGDGALLAPIDWCVSVCFSLNLWYLAKRFFLWYVIYDEKRNVSCSHDDDECIECIFGYDPWENEHVMSRVVRWLACFHDIYYMPCNPRNNQCRVI